MTLLLQRTCFACNEPVSAARPSYWSNVEKRPIHIDCFNKKDKPHGRAHHE